MTKVSKIVQLKSLWGFFKSTMSYGFSKASSEEIHYRKYQCLTCPNIRVGVSKSTAHLSLAKRVLAFFSKADFSSGKKIACGVCGCKVSWRITPAASYCPDKVNPRWFAEKRDFFFSEWLRSVFYKKDKQIAKP